MRGRRALFAPGRTKSWPSSASWTCGRSAARAARVSGRQVGSGWDGGSGGGGAGGTHLDAADVSGERRGHDAGDRGGRHVAHGADRVDGEVDAVELLRAHPAAPRHLGGARPADAVAGERREVERVVRRRRALVPLGERGDAAALGVVQRRRQLHVHPRPARADERQQPVVPRLRVARERQPAALDRVVDGRLAALDDEHLVRADAEVGAREVDLRLRRRQHTQRLVQVLWPVDHLREQVEAGAVQRDHDGAGDRAARRRHAVELPAGDRGHRGGQPEERKNRHPSLTRDVPRSTMASTTNGCSAQY